MMRSGELLQIRSETVSFGRNIIVNKSGNFELQHRLFVNDPWELIAEAIHRALRGTKDRDIAHSFRRQAEDYFRAATLATESAVRPVLLYYAFLNLSKAYGIIKGNKKLLGKITHGISTSHKPRLTVGALLNFQNNGVFQELLQLFNANVSALASSIKLGRVLPQILPGHRLWCYATKGAERFLSIEKIEILHTPIRKQIWINIYIGKDILERLKLTNKVAISNAGFASDFQIMVPSQASELVCFEQKVPETYKANPAEALAILINGVKNRIWETVKVASPYRKPYIYCCPSIERTQRLPQLLSIYLLMFFFSSVTRYSPLYFEDLLDSKFGPFFDTFISESPMQFLYLMASEILECEVSKPAII